MNNEHEVRIDRFKYEIDYDWLKSAWQDQQVIYQNLGDRSADQLSQEHMKEKVKIALCCCCLDSPTTVEKVTDAIVKVSESSVHHLSFVFIYCRTVQSPNKEFKYVVFRVGDPRNYSFIYIDADCRKYISWDEFIKYNTLYNCVMIYPKGGSYYDHGDYLKLVVGKSPDLLLANKRRKFVNGLSTVSNVLAGAVLLTNPVSAPILLCASAVTLATGLNSVKSGVKKLADIHRHEVNGLSLGDTKTKLALFDVGLSAASSVTVGASSALKAFTVRSGIAFAEGSLAYKIVNNVPKITKTASNLQLSSSIAKLFINSKHPSDPEFKKHIIETLLFSFNVYVMGSEIDAISLNDLLMYIGENILYVGSVYFPTTLIKCVTHVPDIKVLQEVFSRYCPDFQNKALVESITNSLDRISVLTREWRCQKLTTLNYVKLCVSELENITATIKRFCFSREEFDKNCAKSAFDKLFSSNRNVDILKQVKDIASLRAEIVSVVKIYSGHNNVELIKSRENSLFSTLEYMVNSSKGLSDQNRVIYDLLRMQFYCTRFKDILTCMKEDYCYQCFKSTLYGLSEIEYINQTFHIVPEYFSQYIFDSSLCELKNNWKSIDEQFQKHYKTLSDDEKKDRHQIYSFSVPNCTKLSENEFYEQLLLIEGLSGGFRQNNSDFVSVSDQSAFIKSRVNNSELFFHTSYTDSGLDCVVVCMN